LGGGQQSGRELGSLLGHGGGNAVSNRVPRGNSNLLLLLLSTPLITTMADEVCIERTGGRINKLKLPTRELLLPNWSLKHHDETILNYSMK